MSELISDRQLSRHHMENFKGRPAAVWVDHCGWLWASLGEWGQVLLMPASLRPRLFSDASMRARVLKEKRGEPFELCDEKGDKWYRWAAVNDGLLAWYFRTDVRRQARDDRLNDDEHDLFANVDGIRAWGDAVQEKALSGAMRIATDKAPALSNSAALAQVMGTVAGIVQDHEARLLTVEQKVHRDPVEFIDAMSFVLESGLAPNKCIPGTRQTLQAWLGVKLSASGAPRGPRVGTRLDGCSQFTEVNTYRRCDLQAMLDSVPKA